MEDVMKAIAKCAETGMVVSCDIVWCSGHGVLRGGHGRFACGTLASGPLSKTPI